MPRRGLLVPNVSEAERLTPLAPDSPFAVIGAGSWGTALAKVLSDSGRDVTLWARDPSLAESIKRDRVNAKYLPTAKLSARLNVTSSLQEAVSGKAGVLWVVPAQSMRAVLQRAHPHLSKAMLHVCCAKGIENASLKCMSDVFVDELGATMHSSFATLGGPSFAKEVADGQPTAVCVASHTPWAGLQVQDVVATARFRVYTSSDVVGVEIGGATKNVIAIATGAAAGLGFGYNTISALITRGLGEMSQLAASLGADPRTVFGLSGMGDLALTCMGDLSRNRHVGFELGRGRALNDITRGMKMVAEGVTTARSVYRVAQRASLDLPILREVHQVLYEGASAKGAVERLMARALKKEFG